MEDDLKAKRPQWKPTSMEDDINGKKSNGRRPKWKIASMEYDLNRI